VRFGLFYEHQLPRPWESGSEEKLFAEALDQIELADKLGLDYVWVVEHHFLEEYSHSSAPEVFLGAASQRTRRIRLGHGIVQIPPAFNHPVRVAERIATLDLISGGRVDFGSGQGSSQAELGGFRIDRALKHDQWKESLEAIVAMMVEKPFAGYQGRFVSVPPRNIVPKPKQQPHPPLWLACSRRETIVQAAELGMGALSFSFIAPEKAKEWVDGYYAAFEGARCVPAGLPANPNIAVVLPFMCHRDEQTALDRGLDGAHFFFFSLAYYYAFGEHQPGYSNVWRTFAEKRADYGFARDMVRADNAPLATRVLQEGLGSFRGAIGTPEQIGDLIAQYERAGIDQIIFAAQTGRNAHEHVCESLELFARELLPRFSQGTERREREKTERLAPVLAQALARRPPARELPRGYIVKPQGEPACAPPSSEAGRNGDRRVNIREAVFATLVRGRSDGQLERWGRPALWMIFKGMERAFRPERAAGFAGEIEYELTGTAGAKLWVLTIAGTKARSRAGRAAKARIRLKMSVPVFLRVCAGLLDPTRAMLDRQLEVEGDFQAVFRINEMFGRQALY
jgi:alkanesulfonate monooxygenase SsuD/methylene tetrahydromethanopterin reductase-like flavin-dependent oxidoreductase (luciferase family)/putative sterol carrier protein